ncbi:hypothetical protein [Luteolibacter pohnpeiensis]|nr:hypothetical protein [Luteolibacter pohnpeiensis]
MAAKAIAAAGVNGGIGVAVTAWFAANAMRTTPVAVPIGAILLVSAGLGLQHQSIAKAEQQLASPTVASIPIKTRASRPVVSAKSPTSEIGESSINWPKVVEHYRTLDQQNRDSGIRFAYDFQQSLAKLSDERLAQELDAIESTGLNDEDKATADRLITEVATTNIPGVFLNKFSDRINPDSQGFHQEAFETALANFASKKPGDAIDWLDRQIAEGGFESKSLDEQVSPYWRFEGHMIWGLLSSNPQAAANRIRNFPENMKQEVLTPYKMGRSIRPEDRVTYVNLVREVLPEQEAIQSIADLIEQFQISDDFSPLPQFTDEIHATSAEMIPIIQRAAQTKFRKLSENRKVKLKDIEAFRKWVGNKLPDQVDQLTGKIIPLALFTQYHALDFEEAAAIAISIHQTDGNDDLLIPLIKASQHDSVFQPIVNKLIDSLTNPETREQMSQLIDKKK